MEGGKCDTSIDKILKLRQDGEAGYYIDFLEFFIPSVVGKMVYKDNCCIKRLSEYVSISDEAFAILVLENNIDCWIDMFNNQTTTTTSVKRKYTNGGSADGMKASTRRLQGWSNEGRERFNQLFDMVEADREGPHALEFEEMFMLRCQEANEMKKRELEEQLLQPSVKVRHELWNDNEEDDEEVSAEQFERPRKVNQDGAYDRQTNV